MKLYLSRNDCAGGEYSSSFPRRRALVRVRCSTRCGLAPTWCTPSPVPRASRPGEIDGEDYHFVSPDEFEARIGAGDLLEFAWVHGNYYGTRRDLVLGNLDQGVDVLLDLDVQGVRTIRQNSVEIREALVDIFIMPPSMEELRHRLIKRGTETPEQVEMRLANAASEMENWREYRYTLISGSMEEDLQKFRAIMRAERYLTRRMVLT